MEISDESDIPRESPQLPPMPYTTKQRGKRTKHTFGPKPKQTANTSIPSQIYRNGTDCIVADEATEARLNRTKYTAPTTSTRKAGYNFIWGEVDNSTKTDIPQQTAQ